MLLAVVLGLLSGDALADSAPDAGRPFEPAPVSEPLYAIKSPEEDPARQRHIVRAADGVEILDGDVGAEGEGRPGAARASSHRIRNEVVARLGAGEEPSPSSMPLTTAATAALELGVEEAAYRGHDRVRPAHLLLVLLREDDGIRSIVESLGKSIEEITELAAAASARPPSSRPADIHEALREGHPVTMTLGDGLPAGDLGHPHTDAQDPPRHARGQRAGRKAAAHPRTR